MNKLMTISLAILAAFLFACGGGSEKKSENLEEQATTKMEETAMVPDSTSLVIEANDQMQFSTDELKVTEGQVVTLTLKHTGKMAKESMGHNWVLLKAGTDIAVFGTAAVTAPDNEYIPEDKASQVIANTKVVGGGEETSITFTAPKAGYYKFICSFPGHWGVMQGTFTSSPR
ncbi:MAG: azurin [Marinoscillum sp.]